MLVDDVVDDDNFVVDEDVEDVEDDDVEGGG